jgi:uncharacterized membrane protein YsdA (DUF1294 family)
MKLFILYLILINVATFLLYGIDKGRARKDQWRIPESRLILFAVLGGSIGAFLGMHIWHHKTKHLKFTVGVPVIFLLQCLLFFFTFHFISDMIK